MCRIRFCGLDRRWLVWGGFRLVDLLLPFFGRAESSDHCRPQSITHSNTESERSFKGNTERFNTTHP